MRARTKELIEVLRAQSAIAPSEPSEYETSLLLRQKRSTRPPADQKSLQRRRGSDDAQGHRCCQPEPREHRFVQEKEPQPVPTFTRYHAIWKPHSVSELHDNSIMMATGREKCQGVEGDRRL